MISQLEDNLEKFIPTEMWKPSYYQWLLDFLDQKDHSKIFFWVEDKDGLLVNYSIPPKFYGKCKDTTLQILPPNLNLKFNKGLVNKTENF